MLRVISAFILALLVAYLIGSILATQVILAELRGMGMSITLSDRLNASLHDLLGLWRSYLPLLAIALVPALAAAAALGRAWQAGRPFLYPLAAAAGVVCLHLAMREVLGLNGLAAVREWTGLALQAVAGWVGGYFFVIGLGLARR